MRGTAFALVVLLVVLALPPASTRAQSPSTQAPPAQAPTGMLGQSQSTAPVAAGTTFRTTTELVSLNVTVTDAREHYVTGLSKDDFAVFEDGVAQNVTFFGTSNVPLDLVIMIDTSASMTDKIEFVHQAATRFVHTLRPGDRAEILGFSDELRVLAPFTGDIPTLDAAIGATKPHGSTALYTSVYVAIEDLNRLVRQQPADVRRQAIVVLTDGDDTSSALTADDLLDAARRSTVAVYPISVISEFDTKKLEAGGDRRFITEADFSLKSLAQETGGRSFFPLELRDLNGVYEQIALELTSQYSLGYSPVIAGDGAFHRLIVRVLHHPDARSRTRSGYYATRHVQASLGRN